MKHSPQVMEYERAEIFGMDIQTFLLMVRKDIKLTDAFMETLCDIINKDLLQSAAPTPTETNWYFYGNAVVQDAIGDNIRPTIMVRESAGEFIINFNISDHDFAVSIDAILSFKRELENRLAQIAKS